MTQQRLVPNDEERLRVEEFERASHAVMGGAQAAFLRALAGTVVLIAFVYAYATFGEVAIWASFAALFGVAAYWLRRIKPALTAGDDNPAG